MKRAFRLVAPAFLPTAPALLFTAPQDVNILSGTVTNSSGSAVTLYIYFVPLGKTPTSSNLVLVQSIPASSTVSLGLLTTQGQVLAANETLQASASVVDALSLLITGAYT